MIYIISPYKTLTNTILASFIFNNQFPNKQLGENMIPEEKDGKYIIRLHTDYNTIEYINNHDYETEDVTIISVVRDPISQYISGYFQDISSLPINYGSQEKVVQSSIYEIIDHFNTINFCAIESYNMDTLFRFYDDVFGFCVFDYDNNDYFTKGYGVYDIKNLHNNNIKIIIIRSDKLNNCIQDIGKIFNINNMTIINSNLADEKWYSNIYKTFKKTIINENKIENINDFMNQQYVRFFYTKEEQNKMYNYANFT